MLTSADPLSGRDCAGTGDLEVLSPRKGRGVCDAPVRTPRRERSAYVHCQRGQTKKDDQEQGEERQHLPALARGS
jgi:hypothetical protein